MDSFWRSSGCYSPQGAAIPKLLARKLALLVLGGGCLAGLGLHILDRIAGLDDGEEEEEEEEKKKERDLTMVYAAIAAMLVWALAVNLRGVIGVWCVLSEIMDTISGTILGKGLWKLVLPEVFRGQVTLENDGHRRRTFRRFPRVAVWKLDCEESISR